MSVTKGTKPVHLPAAEQSKRPWSTMACTEAFISLVISDTKKKKTKKKKKFSSGLG